MKFGTAYLQPVYNDPAAYSELVTKVGCEAVHLKTTLNFDAIAFRGTSGAAMAYPISVAHGIPLICVRKEEAHGGLVESSNDLDVTRFLIVDDFINSGNTMQSIIDDIKIKSGNGIPPVCVGILLYNPLSDAKFFTYKSHHTTVEIPVYLAEPYRPSPWR